MSLAPPALGLGPLANPLLLHCKLASQVNHRLADSVQIEFMVSEPLGLLCLEKFWSM